jgi:hypothetical protein
MRKLLTLLIALGVVSALFAAPSLALSPQQREILFGAPGWAKPGAAIDLDFSNGRYYGGSLTGFLSLSRASSETDLLPQSASGYAYHTYGNNVLALSPFVGLLIYESRTNLLLNSTTPATQTTASLATGTYTLWVNGSGSATMSAGTGTGCGTGAATNGTPVNFTITVAGTCTVTVSGSLNAFQLELGSFGTSFIVTAGATATRAGDTITMTGRLSAVFTGASGAAFVYTNLGNDSQGAGNNRIIGSNSGDGLMLRNGSSVNTLSSYNGTSQLNTANTTNWANANKSGVTWGPSLRSLCLNGGTVASDTAAVGMHTTYSLGSESSTAYIDGPVTRLVVYNHAVSNTLLQANTH